MEPIHLIVDFNLKQIQDPATATGNVTCLIIGMAMGIMVCFMIKGFFRK